MEQELLKRIATMLDSGSKEMEDLARNLFWSQDPSEEDYANLHGARGAGGVRYVDNYYPKLKQYCINKFCGKETYESIYGKGSFREVQENVGKVRIGKCGP